MTEPIDPGLSQPDIDRITHYAKQAALFRRRYTDHLGEAQEDFAGFVTAHFIQAYVHEADKRLGVVRLELSAAVERPRGVGGSMQTVHSGKELVIPISGLDSDGVKTLPVGNSASSSDTSQVTARIEHNPEGGENLIIADALGGNQTTPGSEPEVKLSPAYGSAAPPLIERVQVIPGDTVGLQLGQAGERARTDVEPAPEPAPEPPPEPEPADPGDAPPV